MPDIVPRVTSCAVRRGWRWFWWFGMALSLLGGLVIIAVGLAAGYGAGLFLVVLGGLWLAMGVIGLRTKVAWSVHLTGSELRFSGPRLRLCVPVADLSEVVQVGGGVSRRFGLRFLTAHDGAIHFGPAPVEALNLCAEVERLGVPVREGSWRGR
jgi:hypothetical protein